MKNSISQFLFGATQFFKTSPNAIAYHEVFPKQHLLSLFYSREELKRKEGESEEAAQTKSEERIEKINQLLESFATNPSEEAQPNYSDEAVNVINGYQQLTIDRAAGISQEQLAITQDNLNQRFNKYINEKPAPLAGLVTGTAKLAGQKVVSSLATKTIAAVGTVTGPVGKIASFLIGKFGPEVISWIQRNIKLEGVLAIVGAPIGLILGGGSLGTAVLGGGIGYLAGKGISGGMGGIQSGISSVATGAQALAVGLAGATIGAIAIPIGITIIVIPVVVALILFIINSGAYIVPPAPSISGLPGGITPTIQSPYIDIQKTAAPSGPFKNSDLMINEQGGVVKIGQGLPIKYTIRIRPKKGALTNLRFDNKCVVIKKGASPSCDSPIPDKEKDKVPDALDPGNTFEFSYTTTYTAPNFQDSLILDTFTVTADAPEKTNAVAAANAAVTIGNPPSSCPVPGGSIVITSYNPLKETGHGSNSYWKDMGTPYCRWSLPEETGCNGPINSGNVCSDQAKTCPYYGYAIDIFPTSSTAVVAPEVRGQPTEWHYNGINFINPGTGYSYGYTDSTGKYSILFTHINQKANTSSSIRSGESIGSLFNQKDNTHLHVELQVNGAYVKPEEYFCF